MKIKYLVTFLFYIFSQSIIALEVVATTTSMAMLAREIGGTSAKVTELAPPDRDVHYLQARPSMIRALRDANLLIAVGAELEVGWLPVAIKSAANPNVLPGSMGYFEAAAQVPLLDTGKTANRAYGDVHVAGNPHLNLDPQRMVKVATALAEQFAKLDPSSSDEYRKRAKSFNSLVNQRIEVWKRLANKSSGAILYHKDAIYLLDFLQVPLLGTLEPLPGVPPTANHLQELVSKLQGKSGVIIHTPYQPSAGAEKMAKLLNWQIKVLPIEPPTAATLNQYLEFIEQWIKALTN